MGKRKKEKAAGLPGDPDILKAMTEISIIAHLAENEFQRILPEGLTPAQFGVLNHLLRLDTAETVTELASAFQVAQPTMSSTVRKLEDKGFVEFVPDTEDRRIKRVSVTKAGRKKRKKSVKALEPYWAELAMLAPEEKWEKILPALSTLRTVLDARRAS